MLFVDISFAQSPSPDKKSIQVSGKVMEATTGAILEFATISLYSAKDNTMIGCGLSDEKGLFSICARFENMYALVEFLSYSTEVISNIIPLKGQNKVDVGTIRLLPDAVSLDVIEIVGEKSESTFALDKRVSNVGKDLSNKGSTAQDILDNFPLVSVDVDGGVSLMGSRNVPILIDGKPSGLVGVSGANGLKSLPANMIDRVEVITNPTARYEAEGMSGIINIVLKKDNRAGVNGSCEVSGGWPENYDLGSNMNYRKGKTNFS